MGLNKDEFHYVRMGKPLRSFKTSQEVMVNFQIRVAVSWKSIRNNGIVCVCVCVCVCACVCVCVCRERQEDLLLDWM
jgi:hypothetical protein